MKKGLLIGIVVLWVGSVIVVAILEFGWFLPTLVEGILLGAWIYFVRMVWKKGIGLFHEKIKPELAERRLKRLKTFLMVIGTSMAVGFTVPAVWSVLVEYRIMIFQSPPEEDPVSSVILLLGIMAFIIATIGSLVTFLRGRRKPT